MADNSVDYSNEQRFFQWLLRIYVWLLAKAYGLEKLKGELKVMATYIVKDNNPDVGFSITTGEVTDAEGQVITDAQLVFDVKSSDENVLSVSVNPDGKSGTVHFGAPGNAAFTVNVKDANGNLLGTGGDNFTVTTGDPAAITAVATTFDGLTPAPEAPPAEPPTTPVA